MLHVRSFIKEIIGHRWDEVGFPYFRVHIHVHVRKHASQHEIVNN